MFLQLLRARQPQRLLRDEELELREKTLDKQHKTEIWAQLVLATKDRDRIAKFLIEEFGVKERSIVKQMHMTVYHARRPLPRITDLSEASTVRIASEDFRFMVLAPGGENPRPELVPSKLRVGLRLHRQSLAREAVAYYRNRLAMYEDWRVLGTRRSSTMATSAFGPRWFQPHVTLLLPGSKIENDLTTVGTRFRAEMGQLLFDQFVIDVVKRDTQ